MRNHRDPSNERGISLVEQVLAALFVGFLILVWVNSIRVTTKGTISSKNNLRAQNLAMSKMEDVKNAAIQASFGSTFNLLTQSTLVLDYANTHTATIENKTFTWRVYTNYATMPAVTAAASTQPVTTSAATYNVVIKSEVTWKDVYGYTALTLTGYATDMRQ